ncbi:MAG: tetratricopeptide repeat protein [Candidatus Eisenbacteria bacterium]|nr:tetratricopeptide repeat protein [Candidatus Eisenbacteria bacterium]
MDIAGFSRLTDVAFTLGDAGAELIGQEIPRLFDTPVRRVIERGGIITHFAGDAFLALFPGDAGDVACAAAHAIIEHFAAHGRSETPQGVFEFAVKCGIDVGEVNWGILRAERRAGWYFRGGPVEGAARQERRAGPGEVSSSPAVIRVRRRAPEAASQAASQVVEPRNDPAILAAFFDEDILQVRSTREIRPVVVAFVSFAWQGDGGVARPIEDHATIEELFRAVHEHLPPQGRAYGRLLIDDKGLNVLAYFGAPKALEYAEEKAVRFLTELQARLRETLPDVRLRAGVDRGLVYAGLTGGELRHEPALLGDCVNTAVRLMMGAPWEAVYLSQRVAATVRSQFVLRELPPVMLKGKRSAEPVFQFRSLTGGARPYQWPMTGREEELACLRRLIAPLWEGKFGGMAYVFGEPGMGKTRLLAEFRRELEASGRGVTWVDSPCMDQDAGLQPIRTWLYSFFGVGPFTPAEETRTRVAAVLAEVREKPGVADGTQRELERAETFLAALVECRWEGSLYEKITDPKLRFENQVWGLRELIRALAADRPVVMQIEDAHWVEPATATWLGILLRSATDLPILVLLTSRYAEDGKKPRIGVDAVVPVADVEVGRLKEVFVREQVRSLVGGEPDTGFLALLEERTGGNPFFIEQLVLHASESGLLHRVSGADARGMPLVLLKAEPERLPQTLETVLLARFDRLEHDLREGLKHAATLGVRFLRKVLEELLERSQGFGGAAGSVIPKAVGHGVILSEGVSAFTEEQAYLFRHALMQKAAYHLQPPALRGYLHGLTADVLEELFPGREDTLADLAEHLGKAGRTEREAVVLEKAAKAAADGFRNAEAIRLYERLLERLGRLGLSETERMVSVLFASASVQWLVGEWDQAQARTREGLALAERMGSERMRVDGQVALGDRLRSLGELDASWEMLQAAMALAGRCGYAAGVAAASRVMGTICANRGDHATALEHYRNYHSRVEALGDQRAAERALTNIGLAYCGLGEYDRALTCQRESLRLCAERGDKAGIPAAACNLGIVYGHLGQYPQALEAFAEYRRASEEIGDKWARANAIGNMGIIYLSLGDYRQALECFQTHRRAAEELGDKQCRATAIGNMGVAYFYLGEHQKALECHEEHFRAAEEVGDGAGMGRAIGNMGTAYVDLGEYGRALECHRDGYQRLLNLGDKAGASFALNNIADVHRCLGEYSQALACLAANRRAAEELGHRYVGAAAIGYMGDVYCALGNYAKALECHQEHFRAAEELGDRGGAARALGNIGLVHRDLGDHARALECLQVSLQQAERLGDSRIMTVVLAGMAKVHLDLADFGQAYERAVGCLDHARQLGSRDLIARGMGLMAAVHLATGRLEEAVAGAMAATEAARSLNARPAVIDPLLTLAEGHARLGAGARAREALAEVRAILQDLDLTHRLAEVDRVASLCGDTRNPSTF